MSTAKYSLSNTSINHRTGLSEPLAVHHTKQDTTAEEQAEIQRQVFKLYQDEKERKLAEFQLKVKQRIKEKKRRDEIEKVNTTLQIQESENILMKSVDPVRKPPLLSSPLIEITSANKNTDDKQHTQRHSVNSKISSYARSKLLGDNPRPVVIPCNDSSESTTEESDDKENSSRIPQCNTSVVRPTGVPSRDLRIHRLKESRKAYSALERDRMKQQAREVEHKATVRKLKTRTEKERKEKEAQVNQAIVRNQAESPVKELGIAQQIQKSQQRNKKIASQSERMIKKLRNKLSLQTPRPPSLCLCDADILLTGPEFCATNCSFHRNSKHFAQALSSLVNCYVD